MPSIYGSTSKKWKLRMDYTLTQQSISNNTSTLSLDLWIYAGSSDSYNENENSAYYTIQGEKRWNPYNYKNTGWYKLGSKTITVSHNSDGTGSVTLTANWDCGFTSSYTPRTLSLSGAVTLSTIPRASTVTATGTELGSAVTISITRASSAFTHKLYYTCGNQKNKSIASSVSTSYSWTPPISLAAQYPNSTSVPITITAETYNGSTLLGSDTAQIKLSVPSSVKPEITSITDSDPTGNKTTYGAYVQRRSKIKVSVSAQGAQGSTITSYSIKVSTFYTGSTSSVTTGYIPLYGTLTLRCSVTDSRGRTAYQEKSITVYSYSNPTVSALSAARCNQDGTANKSGAYGKVTFSAAITSLNSKNTASYSVQYRVAGASSWTTAGSPAAGNYKPSSITTVFAAATDKRYEVRVVATDKFTSVSSTIKPLPAAFFLMHLAKSLKSIGIGRICDKSNALQVGVASYFDGRLHADAQIEVRDSAGNPWVGLNDGDNWWYLQALKSSGKMAIGPAWGKSVTIDDDGGLSAPKLQVTSAGNLGAIADKIAVLDSNGGLAHRTASEIKSDLGISPKTITITSSGSSLKNFSAYAKFAVALSVGFIRIYGNTNAALSANADYKVATLSGNAPSSRYALSTSSMRRFCAWISGDSVYIRPYEDIAAGYDMYIAGIWMA